MRLSGKLLSATVIALVSTMKSLICLLAAIVAAESVSLYLRETTCSTSLDCSSGTCCRDANNILLNPAWSFQNDLLLRPQGNGNGMCKPGPAQLKEVCSGGCPCAKGLACYTPLTGACCPASRCETQEYVNQMNEYWNNCHPPKCFYPVRK
ncbi:uncharacterized protein LOC125374912 [Haliotis rufescens]|uniref:uncharacterized protein LOC125374912 n=1 Tax=Haliotis rufescens TaxID=6454 RepID=UPI00201EC52F|nr:uncharacterized protein LOC125374912 [Haliotis rufescens]